MRANTTAQQLDMLRAIGVNSIEDLLAPVPAEVRLRRPLNLPPALPELDVRRRLAALAARERRPGLLSVVSGRGQL